MSQDRGSSNIITIQPVSLSSAPSRAVYTFDYPLTSGERFCIPFTLTERVKITRNTGEYTTDQIMEILDENIKSARRCVTFNDVEILFIPSKDFGITVSKSVYEIVDNPTKVYYIDVQYTGDIFPLMDSDYYVGDYIKANFASKYEPEARVNIVVDSVNLKFLVQKKPITTSRRNKYKINKLVHVKPNENTYRVKVPLSKSCKEIYLPNDIASQIKSIHLEDVELEGSKMVDYTSYNVNSVYNYDHGVFEVIFEGDAPEDFDLLHYEIKELPETNPEKSGWFY